MLTRTVKRCLGHIASSFWGAGEAFVSKAGATEAYLQGDTGSGCEKKPKVSATAAVPNLPAAHGEKSPSSANWTTSPGPPVSRQGAEFPTQGPGAHLN